ncbi:hypothetical protein ACX0G9_31045 [Flavitalea flava]
MKDKNAIRAYDVILQRHIDKKDYVQFVRTFNKREENISGFILSMSKDFLLIQMDLEFLLNGYSIIRKDGFDSLLHGKFQNARKRIFKSEGYLDNGYGINVKISLTTWQKIFEDLRKFGHNVIIECEDKNEPDFIIGPIRRITKDKVNIQNFDPAGQLDDKPTLVKYSEITIVTFDDRYSKTLGKYLKPSKKGNSLL